jgi:hypothetical protein
MFAFFMQWKDLLMSLQWFTNHFYQLIFSIWEITVFWRNSTRYLCDNWRLIGSLSMFPQAQQVLNTKKRFCKVLNIQCTFIEKENSLKLIKLLSLNFSRPLFFDISVYWPAASIFWENEKKKKIAPKKKKYSKYALIKFRSKSSMGDLLKSNLLLIRLVKEMSR